MLRARSLAGRSRSELFCPPLLAALTDVSWFLHGFTVQANLHLAIHLVLLDLGLTRELHTDHAASAKEPWAIAQWLYKTKRSAAVTRPNCSSSCAKSPMHSSTTDEYDMRLVAAAAH